MAGGRQREFDKTEALQKAMLTFWQNGYAGTSLTDLTNAMGINKPSMYATFGNKEQLFIQALDHYVENYVVPSKFFLENKTQSLKTRLSLYINHVIEGLFNIDNVRGCFVSITSSDFSSSNLPAEAFEKVSEIKDLAENFLTEFFKNEINEGTIAKNSSPRTLAHTIVIFFHGAASLARAGKTYEDIQPVVENILTCIPTLDS